MDTYREIIKKNIEYDYLLKQNPFCREQLDGYVELMVEVCCSKQAYMRINGQQFPTEVVKSVFLKLDGTHISYVMECFQNTTSRIKNIRAYTLTALYNSYITKHQYYNSLVSHNMAAQRV